MNGCVIAGIGTEIGKTLVSAIIVEALSADYWKPVQSGGLEHSDTDAVKALVGPHERVFHPEAYRLRVPASPHAAAAAQGVVIEADRLTLPETERFLVVELAGGLMVPLNDDTLTIDMVQRWGLPVVLVASYYLGSINHSLLSIEALRRRNIAISGLVFNGDPVPETRSIILSYSGLDSLLDIPYTDSVSPSFVAACAREFRDARA